MDTETIFHIIMAIAAILIIATVLLQEKGSDAGSVFGGSGGFHYSRRGAEKVLFQATALLGILFVAISLALTLFF